MAGYPFISFIVQGRSEMSSVKQKMSSPEAQKRTRRGIHSGCVNHDIQSAGTNTFLLVMYCTAIDPPTRTMPIVSVTRPG